MAAGVELREVIDPSKFENEATGQVSLVKTG
jgi:hypothetical protein